MEGNQAIQGWAAGIAEMLLQSHASCCLYYFSTPFASRAEEVRAFSVRAQEVAQDTGVSFMDCLGPFYESGDVPAGFLWPDAVHLTAAGQEFLGKLVWSGLKQC